MKQKKSRTPGNRTVLHRKSRINSALTCSECGSVLHGISRSHRGMRATQKIVSRKFGGNLCSRCSREFLRQKARNI